MQDIDAWFEKQGEQKHSWDESENAYFEFTQAAIEYYYDENNPLRKELVDWLKSLKDRIQSKQSNKPQGKSALEAINEENVKLLTK